MSRAALPLLTALLFTAPSSAQVLQETFDYAATGVFPPAGWTATDLGTAPIVWHEVSTSVTGVQTLTSDAAGHRWTSFGVPCLSRLISPTMDFAGLGTPQLRFDSDLDDVAWMAHFSGPSGPLGNGTSDLDVSTDGGATWTSQWSEIAQVDGFTPAIPVDLTAYAGQPAVQIAFRYAGDDGHEWVVDNAVVDNGGNPSGPALALSGSCPGPASLQGSGMTPGGTVALAYGTQLGATTVAGGSCAGAPVALLDPRRVVFVVADGGGSFALPLLLPQAACGVLVGQGLDLGSCTATSAIQL